MEAKGDCRSERHTEAVVWLSKGFPGVIVALSNALKRLEYHPELSSWSAKVLQDAFIDSAMRSTLRGESIVVLARESIDEFIRNIHAVATNHVSHLPDSGDHAWLHFPAPKVSDFAHFHCMHCDQSKFLPMMSN